MVLSLLVAFALAGSGPRLALPPGASADMWGPAAALTGFALVPAGTPAAVELRNEGGSWSLRVAGQLGEVPVPPPDTEEAREDTLRLARSLLRRLATAPPVPRPVPVVAATSPSPPPPVSAPAIAAPEPPPPEPPPPEPPPEPLILAGPPEGREAPVEMPTPIATPRTPPSYWARLGAGVAVRDALAPGTTITAAGGLASGAWAGGLDVSLTPRRDVVLFDGDEGLRAFDVQAGAWWSPQRQVAPLVGLMAGVSARTWLTGDATWETAWAPVVSGEVGVRWSPLPGLGVAVYARAEDDLSVTFLAVGDDEAQWISPWQGQLAAVATVRR